MAGDGFRANLRQETKGMGKNRTFCRTFLRVADFRRLPGGGRSAGPILPDAEGLALMYDIQEQLRRLAPSGGDDRRSLWLEALRGEPEEWADYQTLLDDGEVSDEDDYLALWQMECPDEIAWYEVSVSCFRDRHFLLVSDGEGAEWMFVNREDPEGSFPSMRCDVSGFLRALKDSVSRLVGRICRDPAAYNRYLERRLSHFKRYGSILRRDLFRILPESRPALAEEDVAFLSRLAQEAENPPEGLPVMTLALYRDAWEAAMAAVTGPSPHLSDEQCPVPGSLQQDSEVAFQAWMDRQGRDHCFDLIYARLSLMPVRGEDGCWTFVLVFSFEDYLQEAVYAARAVAAAGYPVRIHGLDAIFDLLSGEDRVEIRPGWTRSCLGMPEISLQRPFDADSEAAVRALIAAADWYPLPEVGPDPFRSPH